MSVGTTPARKFASIDDDSLQHALQFKWIESERAGRDLGDDAIRQWVSHHWWGYLRARWVEHLHGVRYWKELDRNDFGLLQREFKEQPILLDRILDRIKTGQENLHIIQWTLDWGLHMDDVVYILERLDINSRRLACKFGC